MNQLNSFDCEGEQPYMSPSFRVVALTTDLSFLKSNLEPIDGGDDPDIDW